MKTRAASGLRRPSQHGTLSLQNPTDRRLLAGHCRALGLLPQDPPFPLPGPEEDYWQPVHHMSPSSLHTLQNAALPYTCFTATKPDERQHGPWGLCYSDSRLPQTSAFTWEDLQVLGNQPNYCRYDDMGFSPITVEVPENEVERMRWGIHSLCQHTLEAILLHTQGPPPPTWRRGRNRLGQPAFVQTGPPEPTHLGPPPPPPPPPPGGGPPGPVQGPAGGMPMAPGRLVHSCTPQYGHRGTRSLHARLSRRGIDRRTRHHGSLTKHQWAHRSEAHGGPVAYAAHDARRPHPCRRPLQQPTAQVPCKDGKGLHGPRQLNTRQPRPESHRDRRGTSP